MNTHYIYFHRDVEADNEIVYIGRGTKGRAWYVNSTLRAPGHNAWMESMIERGYLPCDWVELYSRGLSNDESRLVENTLINDLKPKFNRSNRSPLLKFTPELYKIAVNMRDKGETYEAIAEAVGLSKMVVHRGLNGRSPSLEAALSDQSD